MNNRLHISYRTPKEIETIIKKSVKGQDEGVKTVATALSAHLLRARYAQSHPGRELQKDNMLILGPTGSGKTESIRSVIRALDLPIPVAVVSANTLTGSGWRGKNTTTILEDLRQACKPIIQKEPKIWGLNADLYQNDKDQYKKLINKACVDLCSHGIIILDEFDKLRARPGDGQDAFFQRMVQHEMLKIIEGGVGFGDDPYTEEIDTTGILFIMMGAFSDMYEQEQDIGFGSEAVAEVPFHLPSTQELIDYGYIPELIGRIPLRTSYNALTEDVLFDILKNSDVSPIIDFKRLFSETENRLRFDDIALRAIAKLAISEQAGARGLRSVLDRVVYPILYNTPPDTGVIKVTEATIIEGAPPMIVSTDDYLDYIHKELGIGNEDAANKDEN